MSNSVAGVCLRQVDAGGSQKETGECTVLVHDDRYLFVQVRGIEGFAVQVR